VCVTTLEALVTSFIETAPSALQDFAY